MNGLSKLPMRHYWIMTILSSIIIFVATLEVILFVKNPDFYNAWLVSLSAENLDGAFSIYLTTRLTHYAAIVIIPMTFSLYTTFAANKLRISGLYIFMWTVLMLASLGYSVLGKSLGDGFLYAYGALYAVIIITLLSLVDVIRESKYK